MPFNKKKYHREYQKKDEVYNPATIRKKGGSMLAELIKKWQKKADKFERLARLYEDAGLPGSSYKEERLWAECETLRTCADELKQAKKKRLKSAKHGELALSTKK